MAFGSISRRRVVGVLAVAAGLAGGRVEAAQLAQPAPGPRLRILIVGDRWDAGVGKDVEVNIESTVATFRTNMRPESFEIRALGRAEFTRDGVLGAVAREPIGPDDALMVMVMAHGAFDPRSGAYLHMDGRAALFASELSAAIRARGNRLGVLLYESCQQVRPVPFPGPAARVGVPPEDMYLFRTLFLEARGYLEMHAAEPGQLALCLPKFVQQGIQDAGHRGSLFTQCFLDVLNRNAGERHRSWESIAEEVAGDVGARFAQEWPNGFQVGGGFGPMARVQRTQRSRLLARAPAWTSYSDRVGLTVEETVNAAEVVVTRVHPGGPAARLAVPFAPGDTISRMAGRPIQTPADFAVAADQAPPGRAAIGGRQLAGGAAFEVVLDLPNGGRARERFVERGHGRPKVFFGASLVPDARGGLLVVATVPGTFAWANNYRPGTLIQRVDGAPILTNEDFDRAMTRAGDRIRVEGISRNGVPYDQAIRVRNGVGAAPPVAPVIQPGPAPTARAG
ncbi:hypothetical protein [Paludisphaera sp.]|uniref:hypothetical protein n=1 Tax=Paludisphaera sp. TaxID=2017432 RepID=UPI00301DEC07